MSKINTLIGVPRIWACQNRRPSMVRFFPVSCGFGDVSRSGRKSLTTVQSGTLHSRVPDCAGGSSLLALISPQVPSEVTMASQRRVYRNIKFRIIPPLDTGLRVGDQLFRLVGSTAEQSRDGALIPLLIWRSNCAECGRPYETTTGLVSQTIDLRCSKHQAPAKSVPRTGRYPDRTPTLAGQQHQSRRSVANTRDPRVVHAINFSNTPTCGMTLMLDGQRYVVDRTIPYTRRDGRSSSMIVWKTHCPECAREFEITTGLVCQSINRRCPEHHAPRKPVAKAGQVLTGMRKQAGKRQFSASRRER